MLLSPFLSLKGVFSKALQDMSVVELWLMPHSGTILCAEPRFTDWFGFTSKDIVGRSAEMLACDPTVMQQLVTEASTVPYQDLKAEAVRYEGLELNHKYMGPVQASLVAQAGGESYHKVEGGCGCSGI
jgi:hypothetical protein